MDTIPAIEYDKLVSFLVPIDGATVSGARLLCLTSSTNVNKIVFRTIERDLHERDPQGNLERH